VTGGVFLSYRRSDSAAYAGRLYDHLKGRFPGRVFMDVGEIAPGHDFVDTIDAQLDECRVMVVLIGREWNASRLESSQDLVRLEIASALSRGVRVVPVLLRGAAMPSEGELPADLMALTRRQALELTDSAWDYGCEQLTKVIEQELGAARSAGSWQRRSAAVTGVAAVTIAALAWWQPWRAAAVSQYARQHETQPASQPRIQPAAQTGHVTESSAQSPFPIGIWRVKGRGDTADPGWFTFKPDNTVDVRFETPEFRPWGTWIYDEPGRMIIMMIGRPPGTRQAWAVSELTEKGFVASETGPGCSPCVYDVVRQ